MTFKLTVLGSGSGAPTPTRYNSAQVLNVHERFVLIDCGEGTQFQLRRNSINFNRIELILISHLHGDHFFGLAGLLNTMHLLGRTKDIIIAGHADLKNYIDTIFSISHFKPGYNITFRAIEPNQSGPLLSTDKYTVDVFPLKHRITSTGFKITETRAESKISKEFIFEHGPSVDEIKAIKKGADYVSKEGSIIPNNEILISPPPPRSFVYASDTSYFPNIVPHIKNVDLLYHEATFDRSKYINAREKYHSTAEEAAKIAKEAQVKQLLIGHFSARYNDNNTLLQEACSVFPNTIAAYDGLSIDIPIST
ncbi:MAG: ribonuclease Z [Marinilabiliales bacterium]|nr:MAG: ribonuclease Z [Marinilabiliales bacterium]